MKRERERDCVPPNAPKEIRFNFRNGMCQKYLVLLLSCLLGENILSFD